MPEVRLKVAYEGNPPSLVWGKRAGNAVTWVTGACDWAWHVSLLGKSLSPRRAVRFAQSREERLDLRLVLKDRAVGMVVLPVEPVVLQSFDAAEALAFHFAGNCATIECPFSGGGAVDQFPGIG